MFVQDKVEQKLEEAARILDYAVNRVVNATHRLTHQADERERKCEREQIS